MRDIIGGMFVLNYQRPFLYEKQKKAIFNDSLISLCEASTKAGKTYACLVWLFEQAILNPASTCWWVAPVSATAKIAFRRMAKGLKKLATAHNIPENDLFVTNQTEMTITISNGSMFFFKSGENPDSLYGEDVKALVIDEASRFRKEAWEACLSVTTATNGKVRAIGNVEGRKNWFYETCRSVQSGKLSHDPKYFYSKLTADDAMSANVISRDVVEMRRAMMSERRFRELYYAEAQDDLTNPFGIPQIRARIQTNKPENINAAFFGVDLAKSRDFTVITGLNSDGDVVFFERFQKDWEGTKQIIQTICAGKNTFVDATGVGDPIVEELTKFDYFIEGFVFTQLTKDNLIRRLEMAIREGRISYPDGIIVEELEAFEIIQKKLGVSYSAPAGMHDDCVISLALAYKSLETYGNLKYDRIETYQTLQNESDNYGKLF